MSRREFLYQAVLLILIAGIAWIIYSATQANLARLGVHSGFDFLWHRAGFEIGQTLIPFNANSSIARAFIVSLLNTLVLALASIAGASVLGLVIGVARLSDNWLVSRLATVYTETFRNIPALLQIFFWYFVVLRSLPRSRDSLSILHSVFLNNRGLFLPVPQHATVLALGALLLLAAAMLAKRLLPGRAAAGDAMPGRIVAILLSSGAAVLLYAGVAGHWDVPQYGRFGYHGGMVLIPEFMALVAGLSMYNATYIGEVVRSGFSAVPRGQWEAAESLGLSRMQTLRLVIFPQAMRMMIPPLTTVYLNLFKATSLAAAVAYPEVVSVFVGTVNNIVGQPVAIMAMTLMIYALVSLAIALVMHRYHRRIAEPGN